jgi:hypothetical protein
MTTVNDEYILGQVKGKIGEILDRIARERPELSPVDREAAAMRIAHQELLVAFTSRPDLVKRFNEMAAEHWLRTIAAGVASPRLG